MIPILFDGVNKIFVAEGCSNLPAMVTHGETEGLGNQPYIVTVWRLTDIEIEKLKESHCIQLNIIGNRLPPVSIQVI